MSEIKIFFGLSPLAHLNSEFPPPNFHPVFSLTPTAHFEFVPPNFYPLNPDSPSKSYFHTQNPPCLGLLCPFPPAPHNPCIVLLAVTFWLCWQSLWWYQQGVIDQRSIVFIKGYVFTLEIPCYLGDWYEFSSFIQNFILFDTFSYVCCYIIHFQ